MLTDLILENEEKIEKFDLEYYKCQKNYPIFAALSALETTNEIQKCYYNLEDDSYEFNALKLYAFLQSLFVSVDSLYALSFSLTKSKSFININKNPVLRELKYIRNDVVGHPANRMYNSTTLAYCILDVNSVNKNGFSYNIYSGQGIDKKYVDISKIVESYYIECNAFLNELLEVAVDDKMKSKYTKLALAALDLFDMHGNYMESLNSLKKIYLKNFPNATSSQHRFLWRVELIEALAEYQISDEEILDLKEYAIGLELIKIYQLFSGKEYTLSLARRKPILVSAFYRFIKKNKDSIPYVDKINDLKHPLILSSLDHLLELSIERNVNAVTKYLSFLKSLYEEKQDALLYAFALPVKDYKK
ncbi:MAG: hypothetical protein K2I88_02610 [Anaeroplasmataceae bacterium]|nr:hypothetical protein [Anaeroplasmataceae bacterium]